MAPKKVGALAVASASFSPLGKRRFLVGRQANDLTEPSLSVNRFCPDRTKLHRCNGCVLMC